MEAFRTKSESYRAKLQAAEIEKVKISRAEALRTYYSFLRSHSILLSVLSVRQSMTDTGRAQSTLIAERDSAEDRLNAAEATMREYELRLEEGSREFTDMGVLRQRISEEMEDERKQYQKDLADRDFTADQTRKKYQGIAFFYIHIPRNNMSFSYTAELAQLSEG